MEQKAKVSASMSELSPEASKHIEQIRTALEGVIGLDPRIRECPKSAFNLCIDDFRQHLLHLMGSGYVFQSNPMEFRQIDADTPPDILLACYQYLHGFTRSMSREAKNLLGRPPRPDLVAWGKSIYPGFNPMVGSFKLEELQTSLRHVYTQLLVPVLQESFYQASYQGSLKAFQPRFIDIEGQLTKLQQLEAELAEAKSGSSPVAQAQQVKLQAELETASAQIEEAKAARLAAEKAKAEALDKASSLEERLLALEKQAEAKARELSQMQQKFSDAIAEKSAAVEEAQQKVLAASSESEAVQAELKTKLHTAGQQLEEVRADRASALAAAQADKAKAEGQVEQLHKQLIAEQSAREEVQGRLDETLQLNETLQVRLDQTLQLNQTLTERDGQAAGRVHPVQLKEQLTCLRSPQVIAGIEYILTHCLARPEAYKLSTKQCQLLIDIVVALLHEPENLSLDAALQHALQGSPNLLEAWPHWTRLQLQFTEPLYCSDEPVEAVDLIQRNQATAQCLSLAISPWVVAVTDQHCRAMCEKHASYHQTTADLLHLRSERVVYGIYACLSYINHYDNSAKLSMEHAIMLLKLVQRLLESQRATFGRLTQESKGRYRKLRTWSKFSELSAMFSLDRSAVEPKNDGGINRPKVLSRFFDPDRNPLIDHPALTPTEEAISAQRAQRESEVGESEPSLLDTFVAFNNHYGSQRKDVSASTSRLLG